MGQYLAATGLGESVDPPLEHGIGLVLAEAERGSLVITHG
jgi:hypothetical protein